MGAMVPADNFRDDHQVFLERGRASWDFCLTRFLIGPGDLMGCAISFENVALAAAATGVQELHCVTEGKLQQPFCG